MVVGIVFDDDDEAAHVICCEPSCCLRVQLILSSVKERCEAGRVAILGSSPGHSAQKTPWTGSGANSSLSSTALVHSAVTEYNYSYLSDRGQSTRCSGQAAGAHLSQPYLS